MKKIVSISVILAVFYLLINLFCYRFPTAEEFITNEKRLNPNHYDVEIDKFDTDVGGTIWFSYTKGNNSQRTKVGIELIPKWVFPWQNYFDIK